MTHANEKDLELDSAYFIAFDMARNALKKGLAESSDLNVTQYRTLMKILGAKGESLSQTRLKEALRLAANVVTGALSVLEEHGYVMRESGRDARTRYISITPAGISHIDEVNEAVVRRLYEDFPTKNPTFRTILEAAIAAGARIDPPLNPSAIVRHPASRALVAIEFIQQETERALKTTCGASFNECRIVQFLGEKSAPVRIGVIADELGLSPVNVARAADRLVQRRWAQRLGSPSDRKAVYVKLTAEGEYQSRLIASTINELASTQLWINLTPKQREAIEKVGHVVIADLNKQREAARRAEMEALEPLG